MFDDWDFYDTIKEKARCYMLENSNTEKWEVCRYSKREITNAGKVLSSDSANSEELKSALEKLNNWRSSHAYPLLVISRNLRRNNGNAVVVQRLKRLDSITNKLKRNKTMSLYRMQDLGGCRVIVKDIEDVYHAMNKLKNSQIRHILQKEDDYIKEPKKSGYRSCHLIYKFYSDKKKEFNKNMLIEIQFRTELQHTWATAVEMMGIYTKSELKASIGDDEVLRFFALVSSVLAIMEKEKTVPDTPESIEDIIREVRDIEEKCNIVSRLSALSVASEYVSKKEVSGNRYYLLILNYEEKRVRIDSFKASEIEKATVIYNQIERNNSNKIDAVLVSGSSFESVRAAYPNYFSDISGFVKMMRDMLEFFP